MRTMSLSVALVCWQLLAAVVAAEEHKPTCDGCGEEKSSQQKNSDDKGVYSIRLCPLWEADYFDNGTVLYYCDRYDNANCTGDPTVDYWTGNHAFPCTNCNDCVLNFDGKKPRGGSKVYPGFDGPAKELNYPGPPLTGPAGRFSQILFDHDVAYVTEQKGKRCAKVFVCLLDIGRALGDPTEHCLRKMYLAFEVKETPQNNGNIKDLAWAPLDDADPHAYSAIYKPQGKPMAIPILVLTASNKNRER